MSKRSHVKVCIENENKHTRKTIWIYRRFLWMNLSQMTRQNECLLFLMYKGIYNWDHLKKCNIEFELQWYFEYLGKKEIIYLILMCSCYHYFMSIQAHVTRIVFQCHIGQFYILQLDQLQFTGYPSNQNIIVCYAWNTFDKQYNVISESILGPFIIF